MSLPPNLYSSTDASNRGLDSVQVPRRLPRQLAIDRFDVGNGGLERLPQPRSHPLERGDSKSTVALERGVQHTAAISPADGGGHIGVYDLNDAVTSDHAPAREAG